MALNLPYKHEEGGCYIGHENSLVAVENLDDGTWATYVVPNRQGVDLEKVKDGKTGLTKSDAFRDLATKRGC